VQHFSLCALTTFPSAGDISLFIFPCGWHLMQLHISLIFSDVVVAVVMLYSTQFTGSTVSTSITAGCYEFGDPVLRERGSCLASSLCGYVSFHFNKHSVCLPQCVFKMKMHKSKKRSLCFCCDWNPFPADCILKILSLVA